MAYASQLLYLETFLRMVQTQLADSLQRKKIGVHIVETFAASVVKGAILRFVTSHRSDEDFLT